MFKFIIGFAAILFIIYIGFHLLIGGLIGYGGYRFIKGADELMNGKNVTKTQPDGTTVTNHEEGLGDLVTDKYLDPLKFSGTGAWIKPEEMEKFRKERLAQQKKEREEEAFQERSDRMEQAQIEFMEKQQQQ